MMTMAVPFPKKQAIKYEVTWSKPVANLFESICCMFGVGLVLVFSSFLRNLICIVQVLEGTKGLSWMR